MTEADLINAATDALRQWRSREIFPTDLSSLELRGLSAELRMASVVSARITNADYLAEVARVVDDMLSGQLDMATGRLHLMRKLAQLGYDPEKGFPQDMAAIPPAERGTLQDASSEARINLMLETNQRIAANYGRVVSGNTAYARRAYPAWELVRLYLRTVPRGSAESHSPGWSPRWEDAGNAVDWEGALRDPMVALKDSPIWQALGDGTGGFTDTLGNPFPPFAFNSGMAWRAVDRARCVALGLITGEEIPEPMDAQLTPDEAKVNEIFEKLPADLQDELRRELATDREGEFLRQAAEDFRQREEAAAADRRARRPEIMAQHERYLERLVA